MTKDKSISSSDIFFFEGKLFKGMTDLKIFIHFLSSMQVPRPYRFSFIESKAQLLPNLNLIDNILLDTAQSSNLSNKSEALNIALENKDNPFLKDLVAGIKDLNALPKDVSQEELKIVGILKGMLHQSDFMFFSSPEEFLCNEGKRTLVKAINIECLTHKRKALICSHDSSFWLPHISKQVVKNEKNEFIVRPMLKIVSHHMTPEKTAGHLEIRTSQIPQKKSA